MILFAENSLDDAYLLQRAIRKVDDAVRVHHVGDGAAAIEYLLSPAAMAGAATCPRLLLLDLHMPGCDGFDLLTWRKTDARWSRLPVVVFSSSTDEREITKAYDLGANSYALKPTGVDHFRKFAEALCGWWLNQNRLVGSVETNFSLAPGCSPAHSG